jgi:hypothetical protein
MRWDGVVTAKLAADVNVRGGVNLDNTLGDYSTVNFVSGVMVYVNGQLMRNGATSGANHDVYPGTQASTGDLKFEFKLEQGDVITMVIVN